VFLPRFAQVAVQIDQPRGDNTAVGGYHLGAVGVSQPAADGGDLGYFTKDQMVPEFADAAFRYGHSQIRPTYVIRAGAPPMAVFMLRSANYRDESGRSQFAGQYEDAMMPVPTAQRALRHGVAVSVADPRRAQLRGVRGGCLLLVSDMVIDGTATPPLPDWAITSFAWSIDSGPSTTVPVTGGLGAPVEIATTIPQAVLQSLAGDATHTISVTATESQATSTRTGNPTTTSTTA